MHIISTLGSFRPPLTFQLIYISLSEEMPNLTLKFEDKVFLEEPTYSMIADDNISSEYFHKKLHMLIVTPSAAHCYHFRLRDNATLLALICDKMYSLCLVLCIYP